jgi:hypothetical protein
MSTQIPNIGTMAARRRAADSWGNAVGRRVFLRAGGAVLGGLIPGALGLDRVLAAQELNAGSSGHSPRDTSVILLYLHGGPSQLETYDLKPTAPSEYRSLFSPIATKVAGMDICEHFPRQASIADRFTLVRSLNHDVGIHSDGGIITLTGKRPEVLDPTSQSKSKHPDFGSIASHQRGRGPGAMPPYVAIPQKPYMTRPTYLGIEHAALDMGDPSAASYRPPQISLAGLDLARLHDRKQLLGAIDHFRRGHEPAASRVQTLDRFRDKAYELLTSPTVAAAFDLTREDDKLRDRYGRHLWGQGCLLARRLAEAGTAVVSLYIDTPKTGPEFTNWDDHIMNAGRPGHFADFMKRRLPYLDESLAALITDLHDRGLDRRVMVVVMGEFGRTPRLSHNAQGTGRDHWPQAYSALIAGGGLRMGQVIGATNSKAEFPTERPYSPQDLLATVYRHLGIDPSLTLTDLSGRPTRILESGEPIPELANATA